jgi:hypothetical protein
VWVHSEEHRYYKCMYAANWMYDTHISLLDIRTWSREDILALGLTDKHVSLLGGVDCDIMINV